LAKFGQQKPVVIDDKNIILAGNGTVAAAKELGWKSINAVRSNLISEVQKTAFAIADNRTAELADWDEGVLTQHLLSLQAEDFDLGDIGFDDLDLKKILGDGDESLPENIEAGKPEWLIVIECDDESHQGSLFDELQQRGEKCKIM